jgi:molybdenum cofactor guanylyltransferase
MARLADPIGVILAGGLGRRIGGAKATVRLCGRPLITYPLEALRAVLDDIAIIAKVDTELPSLPGASVWIEPQAVHHPLVGITQALVLAGNRPILVCAADLPLITPALITRIAGADPAGATAVLCSRGGMVQPLLGCYLPRALEQLPNPEASGFDRPMREVVSSIGPRLLEVEDPDELFNVNSPEDLLQAAVMLDRRRYPNVKS